PDFGAQPGESIEQGRLPAIWIARQNDVRLPGGWHGGLRLQSRDAARAVRCLALRAHGFVQSGSLVTRHGSRVTPNPDLLGFVFAQGQVVSPDFDLDRIAQGREPN